MKSRTAPRSRHAVDNAARLGAGAAAEPVLTGKAAHGTTTIDPVACKVLRVPTKADMQAAVEQLFKVEVLSVATAAKGKAGQVLRRKTYSQVLKPTLAPRHVAREDLQAAVQSLAA